MRLSAARVWWAALSSGGVQGELGMKGKTYNASSSLVRPELVEIKNTIRNLKKDAEMRLTLDVEAQQSFEFLSEQVSARARRSVGRTAMMP